MRGMDGEIERKWKSERERERERGESERERERERETAAGGGRSRVPRGRQEHRKGPLQDRLSPLPTWIKVVKKRAVPECRGGGGAAVWTARRSYAGEARGIV